MPQGGLPDQLQKQRLPGTSANTTVYQSHCVNCPAENDGEKTLPQKGPAEKKYKTLNRLHCEKCQLKFDRYKAVLSCLSVGLL